MWRIVEHIGNAVAQFELSKVSAVGLDETAAKRGQNYHTVFIDMKLHREPGLFVTPDNGKEAVGRFRAVTRARRTEYSGLRHVRCVPELWRKAISETAITVDCSYCETFTRAADEVRKGEGRKKEMHKHLRWTLLKRGEVERLTANQLKALAEPDRAGTRNRDRFASEGIAAVDPRTEHG